MFRRKIYDEIQKLVPTGTSFSVEVSEIPERGDYASNVALALAKKEGKNPLETAEYLKSKLSREFIERIDIASPGFLNFFIAPFALSISLQNVLKNPGVKNWVKVEPKKINLEFVSANPTGPLTMANGRGGFYGDASANILSEVGHHVTREYYVNDAGNQIKSLGLSIWTVRSGGEPKEGHYKGDYIYKLARDKRLLIYKVAERLGKAAADILRKEIEVSLLKAGIKFNVWFYESSLHKNKELDKTLDLLKQKGIAEEKDGALWFADHVLVKSNGNYTYFLADLAYHYDKFINRKFDLAINIWGADHHGYVERMKKGIEALGVNQERLKIIMMQLVRFISKGQEVKMSKRAGEFVTLDELIEMVGFDAARWFFLERTPNTQMDFDLDLAKERSKKNPVFYVQYAHARACSVAKASRNWILGTDFSLLKEKEELTLIKKITQFYETIEDIANDYFVHRLTNYTYGLAQIYTSFYENHKILTENKKLSRARLKLNEAARNTLRYSLGLLGIESPEKM
ncbi:MAG: arginine--tRNA ligase [Patescibacteria group bacterium]